MSFFPAKSRCQPRSPVPACPRPPARTAPTRPRNAEPHRSAAIPAAQPVASFPSKRPAQGHPLQHIVPVDPRVLRDRNDMHRGHPEHGVGEPPVHGRRRLRLSAIVVTRNKLNFAKTRLNSPVVKTSYPDRQLVMVDIVSIYRRYAYPPPPGVDRFWCG